MASTSFAKRRLRLIQAKKRSTTQRFACTTNPSCPSSLRTISTRIGLAAATRGPWARSLVARIGEGQLHERPAWARSTQQRPGAVAVLDVSRMHLKLERAAVGIDQRMPLASLDLLAAIIAPTAFALGRLDALAIYDRSREAELLKVPSAKPMEIPA